MSGPLAWAGLEDRLRAEPVNTADAPYTIRVAATNISQTWALIDGAVRRAGRYVILDLTDCSADQDKVMGRLEPGGNDMNIIRDNEFVKGIVLPLSLRSLGNCALAGCAALTGVTIPGGVRHITGGALADCAFLTSITVDESSLKYAGVDGVLFTKDKTTLIQYPAGIPGDYRIPDGVTGIGDFAFHGCTRLTGVTIPEGVTSIGHYAFRGCARLRSVTVPAGVTTIGNHAFSGCVRLVSVTIPEGVRRVGSRAFRACRRLEEVTIPNSVESIGTDAFRGCNALRRVTIPEGMTSIGEGAFCCPLSRTGASRGRPGAARP